MNQRELQDLARALCSEEDFEDLTAEKNGKFRPKFKDSEESRPKKKHSKRQARQFETC